jgi:hypothetical protein
MGYEYKFMKTGSHYSWRSDRKNMEHLHSGPTFSKRNKAKQSKNESTRKYETTSRNAATSSKRASKQKTKAQPHPKQKANQHEQPAKETHKKTSILNFFCFNQSIMAILSINFCNKTLYTALFLAITSSLAAGDCPDTVLSGQFENKLDDGSIDYYINVGQCWHSGPWWKPWEGECRPCGPETRHSILYEAPNFSSCSREKIRNARADGCSGGAAADRGRFLAACNEHDICYSTLGMPKIDCDELFWENMHDICDHDGDVFCEVGADAFYLFVVHDPNGRVQQGYEWNQEWAEKNCS